MATGDSVKPMPKTDSQQSARESRRTIEQKQALWGWLFLSPWLFGFTVFAFIPIVVSLGFTFTDFTLSDPSAWQWVGLKNWRQLIFSDPLARQAITVTFRFAFLAVPFGIALPLAMATLLNAKSLAAKRIWRTLFYMPYMVPVVSSVFIWQSYLNGQTGWFNRLIRFIGFENPPNWLQDERFILFAFMYMGVWGAGNAMLTILATMQGVPTELYEAADVDGAGPFVKWRNITLPMISPVIFYNLVLSVIGIMQYFDVPYIVTRGTGQPANSAYFFNMHLYKTAFTFFDMGYGATQAWAIFLIALTLTIILFSTSGRWVFYAGGGD